MNRVPRWSPRRFVAALALAAVCLGVGCRDRERILQEAQHLLQTGRAEASLEVLREAIASTPDDAALYLAYGRSLVATGRPSLAVWSLTRAMLAPEHFDEAALLLARAQLESREEDAAVETLAALLDRRPDHHDALRLMIEACIGARQLDRALETAEHALHLLPDDLGLEMTRMRVLLHLDREDDAGRALEAIRDRIPSLEKLSPEERELLAGRYCAIEAMFTHESGRSADARDRFEDCLVDHPDHSQVVASASDYFDAVGDTDRATAIQLAALERSPEDLGRRVSVATRLSRLGEPARAEGLLREVVEQQPEIWSALADHYIDVGELAKALDAGDRAIAGHADDAPTAWKTIRADLLIQLGRYDEAERAIAEIDEEVYAATTRGRLALALGRPEEALSHLERGLRLWPDGTMARYLAARAAEQLGDFDRAEIEYREAYRSDQAYTDAGLQLAELLESRGLPADALTLVLAYLQHRPDDADAYERAVEYALASNDPARANAILSRYRARPRLAARAAAYSIRRLLNARRGEDAVRLAGELEIDPVHPDHLDLLRARCEALVRVGRAGEALERVREARRAANDRSDLVELEAEILSAEGARGEARALLAGVLERDGDRPAALRLLAGLAAEAGEGERAIALYLQAASVDPDDADSLVSAAFFSAPGPERERLLRRALARDPRSDRAASRLAEELRRGGRNDDEVHRLLARAHRFAARTQRD